MKRLYKNIKEFLSNTRYYNNWLWSSRSWDYHWLLEVIILWLKRLENHHLTCPHGTQQHRSDKIHEVISLLEQIIKDEWTEKEIKEHDKKWGKLWTTSKKIKGKNYYCVNFHRKNIKTDQDKQEERKERSKLYKLEEQRKNKAISRCFFLFKKYFQRWWC